MRATHTNDTDYDNLLRFVRTRTGKNAPDIIQSYAETHKIVRHRAGKVFWALVDDGYINCDEHRCSVVTHARNKDDGRDSGER